MWFYMFNYWAFWALLFFPAGISALCSIMYYRGWIKSKVLITRIPSWADTRKPMAWYCVWVVLIFATMIGAHVGFSALFFSVIYEYPNIAFSLAAGVLSPIYLAILLGLHVLIVKLITKRQHKFSNNSTNAEPQANQSSQSSNYAFLENSNQTSPPTTPNLETAQNLEQAKEMFFSVQGKSFELATKFGAEYWKHKVPRELEEEWRKELEKLT